MVASYLQQAVCVRRKNKIEKPPAKVRPTLNTPRNPQQPATEATSRRRATKHVPRVSPYSPASIDPGFCGNRPRTALAVSKNDECYTYTNRQTGRQTKQIMATCTNPGMKRLFCLNAKKGLGRFAFSALLRYNPTADPHPRT